MSTIGSGYDLSSTTFSPEGRVFQVEYACKAVDNSGTAIGIKCKNGIVLAVEKLVHSKLLFPGTARRIFNIDLHAGIATAGVTADGRKLATQAREECKNYRSFLDQPIPGKVISDRLSQFMQVYTLYSSVRPFGASVLMAVHDAQKGFQLYMTEPSGTCWGYNACAVGKGKQSAKAELEKLDFAEMDVLEAVKHAARIIYTAHDPSKDKLFELEMSWIASQSGFRHELLPQNVLLEAEQLAKDYLENDMAD